MGLNFCLPPSTSLVLGLWSCSGFYMIKNCLKHSNRPLIIKKKLALGLGFCHWVAATACFVSLGCSGWLWKCHPHTSPTITILSHQCWRKLKSKLDFHAHLGLLSFSLWTSAPRSHSCVLSALHIHRVTPMFEMCFPLFQCNILGFFLHTPPPNWFLRCLKYNSALF